MSFFCACRMACVGLIDSFRFVYIILADIWTPPPSHMILTSGVNYLLIIIYFIPIPIPVVVHYLHMILAYGVSSIWRLCFFFMAMTITIAISVTMDVSSFFFSSLLFHSCHFISFPYSKKKKLIDFFSRIESLNHCH